eukprot:g13733.t1
MVNVKHKRCGHPSCNKHVFYGVNGSKAKELCWKHAKERMVNVEDKRCGHPGCNKNPSHGVQGGKTKEFCARHAKEGMVKVIYQKRSCGHPSCHKQPSYGVEGGKTAEFCSQHAKDGMVNVKHKRCGHPSCNKHVVYGVDGSKTKKFCLRHAREGMTHSKSAGIFGNTTSSDGDVGEGESPAAHCALGRVGEATKRKDPAPPAVEGESPSTCERNKRASVAATVKVEEEASPSPAWGAAEAVRRTTGGQKKRRLTGAATSCP